MMRRKMIPCVCVFLATLCLGLLFPISVSAGIHITDAAGNSIILEKLPGRIAVVGAAPFIPLHMLYLFEETADRLTGFEVKVRAEDEFLALVDPQISSKQTLQSNPGPESVAALKPDLVISKSTVTGSLANALNSLGIPVMHVGAETPAMFFRDIENLGKVLGNEQRSRQIIQYYETRLSLIHEQVGTLLPEEKLRVLVLEYSNRGKNLSLNVPAPAWIQTRQALISGGTPVWLDGLSIRDGWQITGFEQIAAWNPDKIFLIVWYQLKGSTVLESLYRDSKWNRLTALQEKNLFLFPGDIFGWDSASPRWLLGALWMAKMTYPDRFESLDIYQEAIDFFKEMYRMDEVTIKHRLLPEIN